MCQCDESTLNDSCCSLRAKALFLGYWTLVHGIIYLIATLVKEVEEPWWFGFCVFSWVVDAIHFIGGILLLVGVYKNIPGVFLSGLIISSIVPYAAFLSIYLPIVQIIFTITGCAYMRTMK